MWYNCSNSNIDRTLLVDNIRSEVIAQFVGEGAASSYDDLPSLMKRQVTRMQDQAQKFLDEFSGDAPSEWMVAYDCNCQIPGALIPWGEEDDERVTVGTSFSFVEYVGIFG